MELCTCVAGMIAVSLVLLYYLSAPIPPDGIKYRTLTWAMFTFVRTLDLIGTLLEWLGLCDRLVIFKNLRGKDESTDSKYATGVQTEDTTFAGVKVRIFTPTSMMNDTHRPGIIHIHGGGWTFASVDLYDGLCRMIAYDVGAVLVSIEYQLAPDHPFPIPYEDCLTATKHFLQNAAQYGVNPDSVVIMGDSAGGNLAAAITLALRDEKFSPALKAQVLIYPVVQAIDLSLPSHQQNANGPMTSQGMIGSCLAQYTLGKDGASYKTCQKFVQNKHVPAEVLHEKAEKLNRNKLPDYCGASDYKTLNAAECDAELWNKIKDSILDQRLSPLLADDLSSLPAVYVFTAQYDVLRDEGIMYARRLQEAGNDVTWCHSRHGGCHCMISVLPIEKQPESRRCYDEIICYIKTKIA